MPFKVIALRLGHASTSTARRRVDANLAMKERAPARLETPDIEHKRFRAAT